VFVVALPATADAPQNPPQYAQFDRDSAEITDNFTQLVWDRRRIQKLAQGATNLYCSSTVFPGAGRAPTVKELLTLVDEEPHQEYDTSQPPARLVLKAIDPSAFPDTPVDAPYWTSTPAGPGKFWAVDFSTGKTVALDAGGAANIRCVR
jgi:hypothetical protein